MQEPVLAAILECMLKPFAKKVERTCKDCGYAWIITRDQATVTHAGSGMSVAVATRDAFQSQMDLGDGLRRCPKCGAEHYSQRSLTKRHPASPEAVDITRKEPET
jgi:predicted nucleic-acid-binding Zn-ribbon protein